MYKLIVLSALLLPSLLTTNIVLAEDVPINQKNVKEAVNKVPSSPLTNSLERPHETKASKKPHPKWKKFWADFREGFNEGWGGIIQDSSGGDGNLVNKELQKATQEYIKRNKLKLKDIEKLISFSKKELKKDYPEISNRTLLKMFNNDEKFVSTLNKNIGKRKPGWGKILGKVVAYVVRGIIDNFINP